MLKKRYKRMRWCQYALFALAILSCIVPVLLAVFKVGATVKTTEGKLALGGVAIFVGAIVALIVLRSLVIKFLSKLPFTLTALVSVGALLLLCLGLRSIINDAIVILAVGLVGAFVGLVFEAASMVFRAEADDAREMYLRGAVDKHV